MQETEIEIGDIIRLYGGRYGKVYFVGDDSPTFSHGGRKSCWCYAVPTIEQAENTVYSCHEKPCSGGGRLTYCDNPVLVRGR